MIKGTQQNENGHLTKITFQDLINLIAIFIVLVHMCIPGAFTLRRVTSPIPTAR